MMQFRLTRIQFVYVLWVLFASATSCNREDSGEKGYQVTGTLKKWQPVNLSFKGPETRERDSVNPFLDYRLVVNFRHNKERFKIAGFFAADGDAGNTGARAGHTWQARFSPDKTGTWTFDARFTHGKDAALASTDSMSVSRELWHIHGEFEISEADTAETGFYRSGLLVYTGTHYLKMSETGKPFLKNGVTGTGNFLAYKQFDGAPEQEVGGSPGAGQAPYRYATHREDWTDDDPTWRYDQGKSIIGALNYLALAGINNLDIAPVNTSVTGPAVFPWIAPAKPARFDVSKLDQWEKVFRHMDHLGIAMDMDLRNSMADTLLTSGDRRLLYKELVARFGHHLGMVWVLGGEPGRIPGQLEEDAAYIRDNDPYGHPVEFRNPDTNSADGANDGFEDPVREPFMSFQDAPGTEIRSLQLMDTTEVHREVIKWLDLSGKHQNPWVVTVPEPSRWDIGQSLDTTTTARYKGLMKSCLWGTLMAGGAGNTWDLKGSHPLTVKPDPENFRSLDPWWQITKNARKFFTDHTDITMMKNHDELVSNPQAYCMADKGDIYVVYLPKYQTTDLEIGDGSYVIAFFDPYRGGKLLDKKNQGWEITKANSVSLSAYDGQHYKDWVILIKKK